MPELSNEDVNRIAEALVENAAEDVGVRDIMIGSVMGKGAIPLYGRETRKELCACCLIDPEGPNAPENRMCTTKGAIGTLNNREERAWCSEINIVPNGRCARARAIGGAARECKEKHPDDTAKFFECYIPAFSQITKGSNPGHAYPRSAIPEPDQREARRELRKIPTWKLQEAYGKLKGGEATGVELMERNRAYALSAIEEVLYERGALERRGNPGEYVTITGPGKTTFKVGELISREAFDKENERVRKLSEKPATGR